MARKRHPHGAHPYAETRPFSKSTLRSALSNGALTLRGTDARSAEMRRLRDLVDDMTSDLGGVEQLSTQEQILVRKAAMLTLLTELFDRYWFQTWEEEPGKLPAKGTLHAHQSTTNSLRRVLESLGLQRRMRDVTPTLDQYLAGKGRSVAREAAE